MDIARFRDLFRDLSNYNSFINILAILQDFKGIFSKYSFNITRCYVGIFLLFTYISPLILKLLFFKKIINIDNYIKIVIDSIERNRENVFILKKEFIKFYSTSSGLADIKDSLIKVKIALTV